eukprot:comp17466_c1_seq2/m.16917 comp17466_c1_seq2/g.16917  ORF comp17466_c1_seq2/g.16917 comp17466_c1_seq2/m.16917 type:complete len:423 (-) comp17466_c1_seq2:554-1822(-)
MLIADLAPTRQLGATEAVYSGLQMTGGMCALLAGSFEISRMFPFLDGPFRHAQSLFLLGLINLIICTFLTCATGTEKPALGKRLNTLRARGIDTSLGDLAQDKKYEKILSESRLDNICEEEGDSIGAGDKKSVSKYEGDQSKPSIPPKSPQLQVKSHPPAAGRQAAATNKHATGNINQKWNEIPQDLFVLLVITLVGWVSISAQAFYWTEWIGIGTRVEGTNLYAAFVSLLVYAFAAMAAVPSIHFLNPRFGAFRILLIAEVVSLGSMMAARWVEVFWGRCILAGIKGFCYAIHTNNPFVVGEEIMKGREDKRGLYSGLVNSCLTGGQLLIGAFAGLTIKALDHDIGYFFFINGIAGLVTLICLFVGVSMWNFMHKEPKPPIGKRSVSFSVDEAVNFTSERFKHSTDFDHQTATSQSDICQI